MNHTQTKIWDEEWELIARLNHEQLFAEYIDELGIAWNAFERGETPKGLRSAIHASWLRSHSAGIDAYRFEYQFCDESELRRILVRNSLLISIARDIMRNLLAYNPDGHINLTDANGVTLYFCGQDLTPVGSILSEAVSGTNCTGRCLKENRLVYMLSAENYKEALRIRGKHCAAAPVRDENGVILGVLTLTANPGYFHYHTLGTVQAAAEAISQQLMLRHLVNEQESVMESLNEGVLVVSEQGTIRQLNRYACQVLGIQEDVRFRDADEVLLPESCSLKTLPVCKDRNITLCPNPETRISCVISVVITPIGSRVISMRDNRRVRDITRRVIGSTASYNFDMILGQSRIMQDTRNKARYAGRSDSTVLLTGESGTGKELFAQSIHNSSNRNTGPFLAVNCGAIPRDLVQSELFGYEDGAFTGSRRGGAAGKFELADGGTLFLDEIGDMPLDAQASLLRVLQEGEVIRIGGKRPLKVNVRIVAATNRDLKKDTENGSFRRDLYFRLNVINLTIPPLRVRKEDIKELTEWFCEKICCTLNRKRARFSDQALQLMENYDWPGNVRELENIVERTINLTDTDDIRDNDLPEELRLPGLTDSYVPYGNTKNFSLKDGEKALIELCLIEKQGNMRQVAIALKLSRGALYNKLKRYGIDPRNYRNLSHNELN
ncbi:sigma-54-dependent Fis family transcriptional regulator [Mixta gaviniae]|uniref:Sigma-54-dependent Fis family transcriptional regulator n=1 Tax=Mixta gaviniae TaxID=665914 RepID=A0A2L0IGT9_9GAMM|nr:sigma 54-interacting transcriptional regulator [Mixta gaviniae]AUX93796.1 sigma-54-dependent Fis family transcriptional regulator [Mixta gaviniae]